MATEILAALPLGAAALEKVPGITTAIATSAGLAFQESYRLALRYVSPSSSSPPHHESLLTFFSLSATSP